MIWPFDPLRPLSYDLIVADPPWSFDNWSAKGEAKNPKAHYACRDLDWIKALPVGQLARGDALLWLWATWPMLPQALEVLVAWDFRYITGGPWVKRTRSGKVAFGTGYMLRSASEPFLLGRFGAFKTSRSERGLVLTDNVYGVEPIDALRREHSRKPPEAFAMVERLYPDALRRCELFSREARPGWDCWGDEAGKFDAVAVAK